MIVCLALPSPSPYASFKGLADPFNPPPPEVKL